MHPLTRQKIANNFEVARKSISTYVVAAVTAGGAWWLGKDAAEQVAWLNAHAQLAPLIPYAPWISGAVWVVFRLWPQWFPRPADAKDPVALQFDEWARQLEAMGFIKQAPPPPAPDIPIDPTLAALKDAGIDPPTLAVALASLRASRKSP